MSALYSDRANNCVEETAPGYEALRTADQKAKYYNFISNPMNE